MRTDDPLLPMAIEQIGLVVFSLIGWTGIHLSLRRPVKWKLRRAGTKLKALEGLVRKLIIVLALELDLAPIKSSTIPANKPCDDPAQAPDGIEIIEFPRVRQPSLCPLPPVMDFGEGVDLSQLPRRPTPVVVASEAMRLSAETSHCQQQRHAPPSHLDRRSERSDATQRGDVPFARTPPAKSASAVPPRLSIA